MIIETKPNPLALGLKAPESIADSPFRLKSRRSKAAYAMHLVGTHGSY